MVINLIYNYTHHRHDEIRHRTATCTVNYVAVSISELQISSHESFRRCQLVVTRWTHSTQQTHK